MQFFQWILSDKFELKILVHFHENLSAERKFYSPRYKENDFFESFTFTFYLLMILCKVSSYFGCLDITHIKAVLIFYAIFLNLQLLQNESCINKIK